jgi:hypothetical protein
MARWVKLTAGTGPQPVYVNLDQAAWMAGPRILPKLLSLLLVLFGFFCLGLGLLLSVSERSMQYLGIVAIGIAALLLWRWHEKRA